jgi:hypothetical protein
MYAVLTAVRLFGAPSARCRPTPAPVSFEPLGATACRVGSDWRVVGRCADGDTTLEKLVGVRRDRPAADPRGRRGWRT